MSSKKIIRITAGLGFIAIGLLLMLRGLPADPVAPTTGKPAGNSPKTEPSLSTTQTGGPTNRASVSIARLCAGTRPPAVSSASLQPLLDKHPADPAYHAAVVDVSGETALLRRSLQQWPDSPDLLLRGMNLESTPEARAACARRLIQIEPGNAAGHYGLAAFYAETGAAANVISSLLAGGSGTAPLSETPEIAALRKEVWMAAGYPETEAEIYNSCATLNHLQHTRTLMTAVRGLQDKMAGTPKETVEREELAMLGAACTEHFRQTDGVMLNLLAMNAQITFLQEIDPEAAFGDTGNTVAEQQKQVKKDLQGIKEEFSLLDNKFESVLDTDFLTPSNLWMALAEYNTYRHLFGPEATPGQ